MAGVPGRSGGARSGAGRPRKGAPKAPPVVADLMPEDSGGDEVEAGTPLEYLLRVMNDPVQDERLRVRAAVAAAQYVHTKTHDGGKRDAQADRAKQVAGGKFAAAPPPRLVVNNK